MIVTHELLTKLIKEEVQRRTAASSPFPKGEWQLLQPGDPRMAAVTDSLYQMVVDTYAGIGGHTKIKGPESLARYQYWVVNDLDADPGPDVAIFGKPDVAGQKMGGSANDGSQAAASAYKSKSAELRRGGSIGGVGNWWGEVSGKPAYAMLSRGAPAVTDEMKVRTLLAGDQIVWHGEHPDPNAPAVFRSAPGWYTKTFGDGSQQTTNLEMA